MGLFSRVWIYTLWESVEIWFSSCTFYRVKNQYYLRRYGFIFWLWNPLICLQFIEQITFIATVIYFVGPENQIFWRWYDNYQWVFTCYHAFMWDFWEKEYLIYTSVGMFSFRGSGLVFKANIKSSPGVFKFCSSVCLALLLYLWHIRRNNWSPRTFPWYIPWSSFLGSWPNGCTTLGQKTVGGFSLKWDAIYSSHNWP